jgi:propanol-preferring alcohol dehydrogenase
MEATEGRGVNVVLDCAGAENTISDSVRMLARGGALVIVGLIGKKVRIPLLPTVINEYQVTGSLWGNYNELCEVIELARQGKVKHAISQFSLHDINSAIDMLRTGEITGRAVIKPFC